MNLKLIRAVAFLSLAANLVLAGLVITQAGQIEETGMQNKSLEQDFDELAMVVGSQSASIRKLEDRPEVNLEELASTLVKLRNNLAALGDEVDFMVDDISGIQFRLGDLEYQLERPGFCYGGDVVYWATGFSSGLTC